MAQNEAFDCHTIFTQKIPEQLTNHPELAQGAEGIYEIKVRGQDGGTWSIDLTVHPPEVCEGSTGSADVIVTMSERDFRAYVQGNMGGMTAFLTGRVQVKGDMKLAFEMGRLLKSV